MNKNQDIFNIQTVADLVKATEAITNHLPFGNAKLKQIIKGFIELSNLLDRKEPGIFTVVIGWFRLYLKMQISIDPKNNKLLQQFEKSIPTAISYIICCLQHKTRDVSDYHYNLLDIMDKLLQNCQPNVVKQFAKFENGTISCIWKPITFVGDFNTQLLALRIFARFLKSLDVDQRKAELKAIKWTNLKLFKDNLNQVIEKTQHIYAFESACRDLLNNFNMNLSNKLLVYSFYCNSVVVATKYEFFKPLFFDKFWIDLNYCPHTISFKGRHKKSAQSIKCLDFNVVLKWKLIKLETNCLLITIDKSRTSKLPKNMLSKMTQHDQIKIYLPDEEFQRIKENDPLMGYINTIDDMDNYTAETDKSFEMVKTIDAEPTTSLPARLPLTPKNNENTKIKQPSSKRKFFKSLESDDDENKPKQPRKETKKKPVAAKKSRILKPRNNRKSVCKVVPLVDLTKSPETSSEKKKLISNSHKNAIAEIKIPSHLNVKSSVSDIQLNERQCAAVLNQVKSVCYEGEVYDRFENESDTEPGQSYRNYLNRLRNDQPNGSNTIQTKILIDPPGDGVPKAFGSEKVNNDGQAKQILKSNTGKSKIVSQNDGQGKEIFKSNTRKRKMISQPIFVNEEKEENSSPPSKRTMFAKYIQNKSDTAMDITLDQKNVKHSPDISSISSNDCCQIDFDELEMRVNEYTMNSSTPLLSPHSIPKTPPSTVTMNISDINDTPTSTTRTDHFLLQNPRTVGEITFRQPFGGQQCNGKQAAEKVKSNLRESTDIERIKNCWELNPYETVEQIETDWQIFDDDEDDQHDTDTELNQSINYVKPNMGDCIIYRKRLDSHISDSDSDSIVNYNDTLPTVSLSTSDKQLYQPTPTKHIFQPRSSLEQTSINTGSSPTYKDVSSEENPLETSVRGNTSSVTYTNATKVIVENVTNTGPTTTESQTKPSTIILCRTLVNTRETVVITYPNATYINKHLGGLNELYDNENRNNNIQKHSNDECLELENATRATYIDNNVNTRKRLYELYNINGIQRIASVQDLQQRIVPFERYKIETNNNKSLGDKNTKSDFMNRGYATIAEMVGASEMAEANCEQINFEKTPETSGVSPKTKSTTCESLLQNDVSSSVPRIKQSQNESSPSSPINNSNAFKYFKHATKINEEIKTLSITNNTFNDINNSNPCSKEVNQIQNPCETKEHRGVIIGKANSKDYIEDPDDTLPSDIVNWQMVDNEERFKNDSSEIMNNEKIQKPMANLQLRCLTNSFDEIKHKVCDLTECIVKQYKEQRKELERTKLSMERLMRQLELKYQISVKRSKEYESFRENTQRTLEAVVNLNMQTGVTTEYTNLINQFTTWKKTYAKKSAELFDKN